MELYDDLRLELTFQTMGQLMGFCRSGMMRDARTMRNVKLTENNSGYRRRRRAMNSIIAGSGWLLRGDEALSKEWLSHVVPV